MRVSEIFGPTIQGEGPSTGQPAVFVRVSGCNLDCSWCDTPYTWDWLGKNGVAYDRTEESTTLDPINVEVAVSELLTPGCNLVVITGGEPLVQADPVAELVDRLRYRALRVEVETNGTRCPPDDLFSLNRATFNVSPKLGNSGIPRDRRIRPNVLDWFCQSVGSVFKFVVSDPGDVAEVVELVDRHRIQPPRVWLMPEGRSTGEIAGRLGWVSDAAILHGFNVSSRLHVLAWGDVRGK